MLSRGRRLHRGADIRVVARRGSRARRDGVLVQVAASAEGSARVAVVVGKPCGNAVARNRLRRRVRHVVAGCWEEFAPATDVVVRPEPGAAALSPAALRSAITAAHRAAARRAAGRLPS